VLSKKFLISPQFISTLITFFLAFLLPILSYAQLYPLIADAEELSHLRSLIIFNAIFSIVIGGTLIVLRYVMFYFNKHTLKRAGIGFANAILVLLLLMSGAQLSVIQGGGQEARIFLDVGGIFLLLIVSWSFVLLKSIYEIIIVKMESRKSTYFRLKKLRSRALIPCPNCKYMCQKQWKKCPICNSVLYNK
jgi:hypothetical protein